MKRTMALRLALRLVVCLILFIVAIPVRSQQAPLLEVLPKGEQVRQLELRGDLLMIRKRYLEAIDTYKEAIEFDPKNAVLLNKLGIAHHQVFELRDAEKYYKRATKAEKTYAQAWNNLGTIHYGRKSFKSAVKNYQRALEHSPANAPIRSNLGSALLAQKKFNEAMAQYRLALLIDPEVFDRRGGFGVLLQQRSVGDRARYYFVLAKTFIALGYISKGLQTLRRALENGLPVKQIRNEEAFAILQENPAFRDLLENPPVAVR